MNVRRKLASAASFFAVVGMLLAAPPAARAAGETLQVTREVNTVLGGATVTLTARLSANATQAVKVNFSVVDGPGRTGGGSAGSCQVAAGSSTCEVAFTASEQGTSRVRAWIDGTTADATEGRLANRNDHLLGLDAAADCTQVDDELLENTCRPPGATDNAGGTPEPDTTDVVQITWTSFVDGRLDCDDGKPSDGEDTEYNNLAAGERTETYGCLLTTRDDPPRPIANARIDGELYGDAEGPAGGPDIDNGCTTGADGRCGLAVTIAEPFTGSTVICFWAEPGDPGVAGDQTFNESGVAIDGGGCDNERVDDVEGDNLSDAVLLDIDVPRASRLDATPETQTASPGNRFTVSATVYDQFGNPFPQQTEVRFELFENSPLDADGNNPGSPDVACLTGAQGRCTAITAAQSDLGANLACVWFASAAAPPGMIGDNLGGSCDGEELTDGSADEGVPQPAGDRLDVVAFAVQSRPGIFTVDPSEKRQELSDVLRVTGVNFVEGAHLSVAGGGVAVGVTRFGSAGALEADITVAADAAPGRRDVVVTNPDGGTASCRGCFTVIGQGYWMVAADGGIFTFGDARFAGSTGNLTLTRPIVGMAPTPSGEGYWLVASDGGIFSFGDAPYLGSAGNLALKAPIVGMAATPSGRGYWMVAADGGIFSFGDARFFGSTGRLTLREPIVGIAATPTGRGYWMVAADGGIFSFGDARFFGSTGSLRLNAPVVAMAATNTGGGYWLVASDGGIFSFGDAVFYGGTGDIRLNRPIVGMVTTPFVRGYWLVASDGGIFSFGDARFFGSTGDIRLNQPIVAIARR